MPANTTARGAGSGGGDTLPVLPTASTPPAASPPPAIAGRSAGGSRGAIPGLPTAGQQAPATASGQTAAALAAMPAPAPADAPDIAMLDVFRGQLAAGKTLSRLDDVYAERTAQLSLEYDRDGTPRPWSNPETGTTGTVTPTRTYQKNRTYCREYSQTIQLRERGSKDVKAQGEASAGIACRQPDGKWKFQS